MVHKLDFTRYHNEIGRLRFDVFVGQLGWPVGDSLRQIELDALDATAHHLGVLGPQGRLEGYVRFIQGGAASGLLMQQPAFAPLCPKSLTLDHTTGEVSRLCVRPGRLPTEQPSDGEVVRLLMRALYDLGTSLGCTIAYATTSDTMHGYVNRSMLELLTFKVIAGPCQFQSGVNTYLMSADSKLMAADAFTRTYLRL